MRYIKSVWEKIKKNRTAVIVCAVACVVLACTFFMTPFAQNNVQDETSVSDNSSETQQTAETSYEKVTLETSHSVESESSAQTEEADPDVFAGDSTDSYSGVSEESSAPTVTSAVNSDYGQNAAPPAASQTENQTSAQSANNEPPRESDTNVQRQTYCTLSVSCATILNNISKLDPEKTELVPSDGWILKAQKITFSEGESVYDILRRVCNSKAIHFESSFTPIYNSAYIEGIGNLYEFDCGSMSGWMYSVNGEFPNYSCSKYTVSDGDVISLVYTCSRGADIGASTSVQQQR